MLGNPKDRDTQEMVGAQVMAQQTFSARGSRSVGFLIYDKVKRVIGFTIALLAIIGLLPLWVIVAVAIKIDSPGPVFFRQTRVGRGGKEFDILKFRSMVAENDIRDNSCEDKYTCVGKFIRKTSIDELPQLLNILAGQMAFVGPRPWIPEYWANMNARERGRAVVRPGITGLAQAKGRNGLTIFQKIEYDLEYVANYSLTEDIKVILITIATVVKGSGVNAGKAGVHEDLKELKLR